MSLTRIQQPTDLLPPGAFRYIPTATKHPINIVAQANNTALGSIKASLLIRLGPNPLPASPVNLTINGNTYVFSDTPTPGQLPWTAAAVDSQPTPVVSSIVQAMYALYYALSGTAAISADYEVRIDLFTNPSSPRITLEAKEFGPQYTTTQLSTAGAFLFTPTPGSSSQLADNLDRMRARLRVYVDQNFISRANQFYAGGNATITNLQDWALVATLERPFIPNEDVMFDVQDVLRPYCRPTSPVFTVFISQYEKYKLDANAARRWYYELDFNFFDSAGTPQARRGFEGGVAARGGDTWATWAQLNPYLNDQEVATAYEAYWGMLLQNPGTPGDWQVKFLSGQPTTKRVDLRSIEYLTFFKGIGGGFMHMEVTRVYTDGEIEVDFVPEFSRQVIGGGIVRTEVSPRAIPGLADSVSPVTSQPLESYSVQFYWTAGSSTAGAVPVTEVQTYEVNYDDQCDDVFYQVMFLNRLGGFDSLWIGSRVQETIDRKAITYQTYRRPELDKTNADYEVLVETATVGGQVSAGYVDSEAGEWLQTHLTASDEVYMLAYDSRLGGFNYRRISVDKLAIQVNMYRQKGLESTADFDFTYLIDLK